MKKLIFIALSVIYFFPCSSQTKEVNTQDKIDGRTFYIESFMPNGESIGKEYIIFESGTMGGSTCDKYEYDHPKYTVSKEGKITATMTSPTEGVLYWDGEIKDGKFIGTSLWKKEGQDDILISFEGKEVVE